MTRAREWYERRTSAAEDWPLADVVARKGSTSIAVVVPARNEAATVGEVVRQIGTELAGVVDELVVMDSLSDDDTAAAARAAGAAVWSVAEVRTDLGVRAGKGEALWKSQFVTRSDISVFIDADLTEWGTHFVTGLVGPLLADPDILLARGFYDRILDVGDRRSAEGGRVTELIARPWLAQFRPSLSAVVQPLAGEWAIRSSLFSTLSVPVGYGVELATLLDTEQRFGLDAIAQVDLGQRAHRHQHLHDLGAMATELLAIADRRRSDVPAGRPQETLPLERLLPDRTWETRTVDVSERPPYAELEGE